MLWRRCGKTKNNMCFTIAARLGLAVTKVKHGTEIIPQQFKILKLSLIVFEFVMCSFNFPIAFLRFLGLEALKSEGARASAPEEFQSTWRNIKHTQKIKVKAESPNPRNVIYELTNHLRRYLAPHMIKTIVFRC